MTHRQYDAWQEWLEAEWNKPSRSDHYQMQTTAEVRRSYVGSKAIAKIKASDMKLKFESVGAPQPIRDPKKAAEIAKQVWLGRMKIAGVPVEITNVKKSEQ